MADFSNLDEQARLVLGVLTKDQISEAFGAADPHETFVAQRRAELEKVARGDIDEASLTDERLAASGIIELATTPRRKGLARADKIFKITGWIWLGSGLLAAGLASLSGGEPTNEYESWEVTSLALIPFLICVAAFPIAGAALVWKRLLERAEHRAVRSALLDWASTRRGQLARGLPMYGTHTAGPEGGRPLVKVLGWGLMALGMFIGPVGILVGLITMISGIGTSPWLALAGVVGVGLFFGGRWILRSNERTAVTDNRVDRALYWLWESEFPRDLR